MFYFRELGKSEFRFIIEAEGYSIRECSKFDLICVDLFGGPGSRWKFWSGTSWGFKTKEDAILFMLSIND